ncbi:MAG: hypothetical protein C4326_11320 [Ignavibacteria bacterium]
MTFSEYLQLLGGTAHLYANASNAMKDALEYIAQRKTRQRPNIVLPAYIPAKLYRTALAAGYDVKFYEVFDKCVFDLAEVEQLIDENTLAVFHVHYFGFPYRIGEMRELTRKRNVLLIEDCALSIGATHDGRHLGTYGDFAVFSMRKMFLYSEGGFLRLAEPFSDFRPHYEWQVRSCFSLQKYLGQRAKYVYVRLTAGTDPLHIVRPDPVGYMDWSTPRQVLHVKRPSAFTEWRLNFVDVEKVVRRRRENFMYVAERFPRGSALEPLHDGLTDGCTPYSFPFLVKNGQRDRLRQELFENGTMSGAGWPESPFHEQYKRTRELSARLLEIPIHQALTRQQIDRSLRVVQRAAR